MGCLTASVKLLNEQISASAKCLNADIVASARLISEHIRASVRGLNAELTARVVDLSERLNVRCDIVCSLADVQYLEVSPTEVQWITPDEIIMYTVTSNVDWEIQ